jgi:hypothetical protein
MSLSGKVALIFASLCVLTIGFSLMAAVVLLSNQDSVNRNLFLDSNNLLKSPIDTYHSEGKAKVVIASSIERNDGRSVIVDNFLSRHRSPMQGMGSTFVFVADKYGIDWKLLPAIAFQESNLGKKIPKNSYNAWGWAVYTGANSGAAFDSWESAIETVARGIKEKYITQGLTTPEAIMTKYTPSSDGSWAYAVRFAMEEMVQ